MDIHVLNSYAKVTIKAVAGRRVRFLGIGRRVEVGEKLGRSQSHLKVLCFLIHILSIRLVAG